MTAVIIVCLAVHMYMSVSSTIIHRCSVAAV